MFIVVHMHSLAETARRTRPFNIVKIIKTVHMHKHAFSNLNFKHLLTFHATPLTLLVNLPFLAQTHLFKKICHYEGINMLNRSNF